MSVVLVGTMSCGGEAGPGASAPLRAVVEAVSAGDFRGLRSAFGSGDAGVRARAALGSAGLHAAPLHEGLLRLLDDPEPDVRAGAAFALGVRSGAGAPALRQALDREGESAVREALIEALGRIGDDGDAAAVAALGGADRPAATAALARLAARGRTGRVGVDSLVARLSDRNTAVSAFAARGLAWSGAPDLWIRHRGAIRAALADVADEGPSSRILLAGFGRLLPRAALERWARDAVDPRTRVAAVAALATHPDGVAVVPALEVALDDPHPWVREVAVRGLAALGRRPAPGPSGRRAPDSGESPLDVAPVAEWTDSDWSELAALGTRPRLRLEFEAGGEVDIRLDPARAPAAVLHLARRAGAGRYDGTPVGRVVPGAVLQWGRPGAGAGATRPERRPIAVDRGTVALARDGPDGDDDLFVAFDRLPELDGRHTVVGRVVDGLDVLETLGPGAVVVRVRMAGAPWDDDL